MAQFKCKMCGGNITVSDNQTTATCEFCGTEQTITKIDNEKKVMLFNRANSARLVCDFDKALRNYESILVEFPNDAEAHWGLCLCRYGIEYVNDPRTGKKIPTCHRTLYTSIFDDEDYKEAIKNADVVARELYKSEADKIDKIQKNIIAVSQKEEPFDIFICYKETDEKGNRTLDSVIAQDIYEKLTEKGYKVFFSRITLETKIGLQYEPIIFAALQSAKVMLAIGSKIEYFNAVWVKNEWSRFLSFMQTNKNKYLIPCFKDMEAYDMPEEFLSLQAQSIDKLGFMQDLIRGIDKILGRNIKINLEEKTTIVHSDVNIEALLTRIEMLLEDEDWNKADDLIEKILNNDPRNFKAYFYKLLIELECKNIDDLLNCDLIINKYPNYKKAYDFADTAFKKKLLEYNDQIIKNIETKKLEGTYKKGLVHYRNKNFLAALEIFNSILNYKDSTELANKCIEVNNEIEYKQAITFMKQKSYKQAIEHFKAIIDYKDSKQKIIECEILIENDRKEEIYVKAIKSVECSAYNTQTYCKAIQCLKTIANYKNSAELIEKYTNIVANNQKIQKEKEEELRKRKAIRKDRAILFTKIAIPSLVLIIFLLFLLTEVVIPNSNYNKALKYIENGHYDSAIEYLQDLEGYSDSNSKFTIIDAAKAFDKGDYDNGMKYIYQIDGTVNVTYDGDGGRTPKSGRLNKNQYITEKAEKDGYTFYGWTLIDYAFTDLKKANDVNITVKASYTPIEYTISYVLDGGSISSSLTKKYIASDRIDIPNPTKKGYTFAGWISSNDSSPKVDYVIGPGAFGNLTLTAVWNANSYNINYNPAGGTVDSSTQKVFYDSFFKLKTPVRQGYKFLGWYNNNVKLEDGTWKHTSDFSLVAKWEIVTFTITYKLNGGVNHSSNPTSYNVSSVVEIKTPTKQGYTFTGWKIDDKDIVSVYTIKSGSTGNKTLEAIWEANSYKMYFDVDGDKTYEDFIDVKYDQTFILPNPTKLGFDFEGWFNGSTLFEGGTWTRLSDIYLTAKWEYVGYSIVYDLAGGFNEKTNPTSFTIDSTDIIIKSPTREGYSFMGWKVNNKGDIINPYVIKSGTNNHVYITAVWSANSYKATFVTNSADCEIQSTYYTYDSTITLPIPTRVGYDFEGWYYNGSKVTTKWTISIDCTLEAEWIARTDTIYTVNHLIENINDSNYSLKETQKLRGTSDSNIYPSVKSYTGFTSPTKQQIIINADGSTIVNYYYSRNSYLVTFVTNGGSTISPIFLKYEQELSNDILSSRNDNVFGGWYLDKNLTVEFNSVVPSYNITLYAYWSGETKPFNFEYIINSNAISIIATINNLNVISIPRYIGGIEVTSISDKAFENNSNLTSITLPNTIQSIGSYSFNNCVNLNSIRLSSSLISLGEYAFSNCSSLDSIVLPENLTNVGSYCFNGCGSLGSINIPNSLDIIPEYMLKNCISLTDLYIPETIIRIEDAALSGCSSLENLTIPFVGNEINLTFSDVNSRFGEIFGSDYYTGSYVAFQTSSYNGIGYYIPSNLQNVDIILGNVTSNSFRECNSIINISVLNVNSTVEAHSFNGCNSLEKIIIPNLSCKLPYLFGSTRKETDLYSITYTTSYGSSTVVYMPYSLYSVTITNEISLVDYAFYETRVEEVILNDGIVEIGDSAFEYCRNLTYLIIPNSVETIGSRAFYSCNNTEFSISTDNNISTINDAAFYECFKSGFESMNFLKKCQTIGRQAFYDIDTITEIIFEDALIEKIWFSAFQYCDNVEYISVPRVAMDIEGESLARIFANMSSNGTIGTYDSPDSVKRIKITQKADGTLSSFAKLAELEMILTSEDPSLPSSFCSDLRNLKKVVISCSEYSIGKYAFSNCISLEEFDFTNCSTINEYAFSGCTSLKSVCISAGTLVSSYAFNDCTGLLKIDVSAENISLGAGFGKGCSSLEYIGMNTSHLVVQGIKYWFPAVTIPTHDSYSCVLGASLKEIYINGDDKMKANCLDFSNVHLEVLRFGSSVSNIFPLIQHSSMSSLSYSSVKSFIVDENNEYYCVYDGAIYTKDKSKLIWAASSN